MHRSAFKAAVASHCAGEQGKFWEMHQSMLSDQNTLDDLNIYAKPLGLDLARQFEPLSSQESDLLKRKAQAGTPLFTYPSAEA